jgi:hypothetical protein
VAYEKQYGKSKPTRIIQGFHRGVLVYLEYRPGDSNPVPADDLARVFNAQIEKLESQ